MNEQRVWADDSDVYETDLESVAPESACVAVYRAVAALANTEPESLEPLGEVLDPDALDALLDGSADSTVRCRVSFRYEGFLVEIVAGDSIRLTPLREDAVGEESG
ncbi:HalOD1 output domain-containing protein [Halosimplex amylolyticum]|uniref:HalOD1 output domain-containing protein n=1 Tax=Halosimplex amylolyticum TaxID=3396616 RepID=UPI003F5718B9